MTDTTRFKSILVIWVVLDHLWGACGQIINTTDEAPDWDLWLSHFDGGAFYQQYRLVWDHSEWCQSVFNCIGPLGEVVRHQMCVFQWTHEVGTPCKNFNQVQVHDTEYEKTRLLDVHNTYRDEVAGHGINKRFYGAANIRRMTWDYSLEDMAINWALQCYPSDYKDEVCRRIQHFDYASVLIERKEFPTNVTWTSEYMVEQWAESLARYHYSHPDVQDLHSNYTPGPWDRATQMLWHATYKLGCGVVVYTSKPRDIFDRAEQRTWYKTVVCYYAPPGNKVGQMVFKEGAPGLCPEGTQTRFSCYGADYQSLCHYPDDPLNKAIKRRTRGRGFPPLPLYSQFVDATVTNPPSTTNTTQQIERKLELQEQEMIDSEPIAKEMSVGSELFPSIASAFAMTILALTLHL